MKNGIRYSENALVFMYVTLGKVRGQIIEWSYHLQEWLVISFFEEILGPVERTAPC